MATILPFDELNRLELRLRERFPDGKLAKREDYEDIIDEMLDLFLLAYAMGNSVTNEGVPDLHGPACRAQQDAVGGGVELQHLHLGVLGAQQQPGPRGQCLARQRQSPQFHLQKRVSL